VRAGLGPLFVFSGLFREPGERNAAVMRGLADDMADDRVALCADVRVAIAEAAGSRKASTVSQNAALKINDMRQSFPGRCSRYREDPRRRKLPRS